LHTSDPNSIDDLVAGELDHLAVAVRGEPQAAFRSEYGTFRKEMLAGDPESPPRAALLRAVASVRSWAPDFEPEYDADYFV